MLRILIVEDDVFVGLDLADQLESEGFVVVGTATTVAKALMVLKADACDAAILDVNLGRETSAPIAKLLCDKQIPFIAVTGYSAAQCPAEFASTSILTKPLRTKHLIAELRKRWSEQLNRR